MLIDINIPRVNSNRQWREWHYENGYIEHGWTFRCPTKETFIREYHWLLFHLQNHAKCRLTASGEVLGLEVIDGYKATIANPLIPKI